MSSPTITASEAAIMDDIVARLIATGAFGPEDGSAEVAWGAKLEQLYPDGTTPSAAVEYLGSTESPISDIDFMIRDGRYTVTLAVREPDPRERGNRLSQLAAVVRNALSNQPLGQICQPFFCRLKDDTTVDSSLPEGRRVLNGAFRYTINDDTSRDESDF